MTLPKSGGAMEERVRVKFGDGRSMIGVSYKGDIEGWRARFVGFCESSGRRYGVFKRGKFYLSNGASMRTDELDVEFQ
jgi:hypothetical protein